MAVKHTACIFLWHILRDIPSVSVGEILPTILVICRAKTVAILVDTHGRDGCGESRRPSRPWRMKLNYDQSEYLDENLRFEMRGCRYVSRTRDVIIGRKGVRDEA